MNTSSNRQKQPDFSHLEDRGTIFFLSSFFLFFLNFRILYSLFYEKFHIPLLCSGASECHSIMRNEPSSIVLILAVSVWWNHPVTHRTRFWCNFRSYLSSPDSARISYRFNRSPRIAIMLIAGAGWSWFIELNVWNSLLIGRDGAGQKEQKWNEVLVVPTINDLLVCN